MPSDQSRSVLAALPLKLHVWWTFPTHHHSGLFESLVALGVDLKVTYFQKVPSMRISLGWGQGGDLKPWESSLGALNVTAEERLQELSDYIHVIPGYGSSLTRRVAAHAGRTNVSWCHWSEAARSGWRWWARLPRKRAFARLVNESSLGAFAQGIMARNDFLRWGIESEKISYLTYSVPEPGGGVVPDLRVTHFSAGRGVFLFVGQLIYRKGLDVLLTAFAKLKTNDWCLIIVGNGNARKYRSIVNRFKMQESIMFLPAVPWDEVASLYAAADVLVLPSRFDGWGVVVNEAAVRSKALVVSSACGSAWHLVETGINGYMVAPGCVDSLANGLRNYVRGGRDLAAAHGVESKRISAYFSCEQSALRLIKTINTWIRQR